MSRAPEKKRYIVSNLGYGYAVHDTSQEKVYYEGIDPSKPSGPKGRIVEICSNAETAWRIARERNAAENGK